MSDKTDIMKQSHINITVNTWTVPKHFKPAIEAALNEFAKDGYIFDGTAFNELPDGNIEFTVTAGSFDIFRLGVKTGAKLAEVTQPDAPLTVDLRAALDDYLNAIRKAQDEHWEQMKFTIPKDEFSVTEGKRFWKIVSKGPGQQYGSVHCFVERETGDIYKAATFNSPAKGVRGNITAKDRPVTLRDYYRK